MGVGSEADRVASPDDQAGTSPEGVVDVAAGTPLGVGGRHRAVRGLGVIGWAGPGIGGRRSDRFGERVGHPLGDDHPVDGDADLTHVRERASRRRRSCLRDVGVVEHDEGGMAAELEQQPRQARGRRPHHRLAGGDRPGQRHERDPLGAHQRLADVGTTGKIGQRSGREPDLLDLADHRRHCERCLQRRLDDHGVAGRQRSGDLPAPEVDRVVPRHDRRHDPNRSVLHERADIGVDIRGPQLAIEPHRFVGVEAEHLGAEAHLLERVPERLALLAGEQPGDLLGGDVDAGRRVVEDPTPLRRAESPPLDLAPTGRRHRSLDDSSIGHCGRADGIPRGRVGHLDGGGSGDPLAADEEQSVAHRRASRRHRSS